MSAIAPGLFMVLAVSVPGLDDAPAEVPKPPVIHVLLTSTPSTGRALKYALLPDPLDLTPDNAAPLWMRAALAFSRVTVKPTEREDKGFDGPLAELPRDELRRYLAHYAEALRLADQAAHCQRCDWERPPWTLKNLDQLPDIAPFRLLAHLLSLRCRLELAEKRYAEALESLRIGLVMGQHVALGGTLIDELAGMAIMGVMLARIEESLSVPGMPNFYWPLTVLPRPLFDLRSCFEYERNILNRSFPQFRRLDKEILTEAQARQMLDDLFSGLALAENSKPGMSWEMYAGFALLAARVYPDSKHALLAKGRSPAEVEKMPVFQVILLQQLEEFDFYGDETLKWLSVPYPEARVPLEKLSRRHQPGEPYGMNLLVRTLMPATLPFRAATVRLDRQVAALRCVEAIRLYAASHGGKPPPTLGAVLQVPLPLDPVTGKGFDGFYKVDGDRATFEVPPVPGQPAFLAKHFEFVPTK